VLGNHGWALSKNTRPAIADLYLWADVLSKGLIKKYTVLEYCLEGEC